MKKQNNITKNIYLESFWSCYLWKHLNTCKDPYVWKTKVHYKKRVLWVFFFYTVKRNIAKNVHFECFSQLGTKTSKCMKSPLYGERNFQKRVFSLFLNVLGIQTLKNMEITLYGNRKHYYAKRVLCVFLNECFECFWVLMPKYMKSKLCGITREHYEKRVLWVLFSFLGTKKTKQKTYEKNSI